MKPKHQLKYMPLLILTFTILPTINSLSDFSDTLVASSFPLGGVPQNTNFKLTFRITDNPESVETITFLVDFYDSSFRII